MQHISKFTLFIKICLMIPRLSSSICIYLCIPLHLLFSPLQLEFALQIQEIFNLFDTDGSETIDRKELDFAMNALGFHSKQGNAKPSGTEKDEAQAALEEVVADG